MLYYCIIHFNSYRFIVFGKKVQYMYTLCRWIYQSIKIYQNVEMWVNITHTTHANVQWIRF
jgi:hypothetical protein